ncbi:MAG: molybdopterin-dependent oxidoreductase [Actinomycetota bacterium]|nr:molybdopterin-dependent oxidoreductase [Actinomycetota bacterium]
MTNAAGQPDERIPDERVTIRVNRSEAVVPGGGTLLAAIRDGLGLTGAKLGCGEGACGACTVLLDGEPVRSCQRTAVSAAGHDITTIEGLFNGAPGAAAAARPAHVVPDENPLSGLHPVQRAFAEEGAAQCGFCTPGMILATVGLLSADPDPDDAAIEAALAGQICRCGSYQRIRRAVYRAAGLGGSGTAEGADGAGRGGGTESAGGPVGSTDRESPGGPADDGRTSSALTAALADAPDQAPDADRWQPPSPGGGGYRPARPWDLTDPAERDWFGALGDGLVAIAAPLPPGAGAWTASGGAWLHVAPDGTVTAFTGKVDVGQDNRTALRLLVAEELGVPLHAVRITLGDTDLCPYDMGTFGSRSMPDAGSELRRAAAFARGLLPVRPGERRVETVTGPVPLSDPGTWRQAGRPHLAPGMVAAVTGRRRFTSDLRLPGLLHAAVLRPPVPGSVLLGVDPGVLGDRPGTRLIQSGGLTAVVADDPATAAAAIADVAGGARWEVPDAPSDHGIADYLRSHPSDGGGGRFGGPFEHQEGSAPTALESAAVRVTQTYTAAYIAPAALETRIAVAEWDDRGRVTVWTGTQTPFPVRAQVAAVLGIGEERVRIIVPATGGAFGGKHAGQVAIEAAICAREAGAPVRLSWSRTEEFTVGTLRPAAVIDIAAGATADGALSGWTHTNINSGAAAIGTPYRVTDQRLAYQPAASPLPQASYRALAATANNFARESAIDELARAAGVDPVEFRLRNLADDRLAEVLRAVAAHIGWEPGREPIPGVGVGIACGLEKDGRVVTAAQVVIGRDRRVRITSLVTGYDCGAIVNPAAVTSQIEGAAVMALGGAMYEAIRFTGGMISNAAFSAYRVPRLADVPPIEVILLDRPDLPSAGAGETPMIAVAPAIASAIFDATGRRIRSLPLTEDGLLPDA